jgi:hypothetical protein
MPFESEDSTTTHPSTLSKANASNHQRQRLLDHKHHKLHALHWQLDRLFLDLSLDLSPLTSGHVLSAGIQLAGSDDLACAFEVQKHDPYQETSSKFPMNQSVTVTFVRSVFFPSPHFLKAESDFEASDLLRGCYKITLRRMGNCSFPALHYEHRTNHTFASCANVIENDSTIRD